MANRREPTVSAADSHDPAPWGSREQSESDLGVQPLKATILAATPVLVSVCVHAADDNTKDVRVARHGAWTTYTTIDTFDDSAIRWYASHPHGDDGGIRYGCDRENGAGFTAHADNMFIDSIGQVMNRDRIRVRVKVDNNPVVESKGKYPNDMATDREARNEILGQFSNGREARIRTEHGDEQHTFAVSLDGFREAANWVLTECKEGTNR